MSSPNSTPAPIPTPAPQRHSAASSLRFYLFLILSSTLVAVALAEVWLRVFPPGPYITPDTLRNAHAVPHQAAVFAGSVLTPQAREVRPLTRAGVKEGLVYDINSLGYRGAEFAADKPPATRRVMIYGGSQVFDLSSTSGEDWPHRIGELLRQRGLNQVEVINAGIPGHASHDSFGRLFAEGHLFRPDIVILDNLWNDIKRFTEDRPLLRTAHPARPWQDPRLYYRFPGDRFLTEHLQLYGRLRYNLANYYVGGGLEARSKPEQPKPVGTNGLTKTAVTAAPASRPAPQSRKVSALPDRTWQFAPNALRQYELNARLFIELARAIGAQPVLMIQPRLPAADNGAAERAKINYAFVGNMKPAQLVAAFAAGDAILRRLAAEYGIPLLDPGQQMNGRSEYFNDHVHLNPRGAGSLAALVAQGLVPIIERLERDRQAAAPNKRLPQ